MATITINEALGWRDTMKARHQELIGLRNENSAVLTRRFGVGGDKEVEKKPTYNVKNLDAMVTVLGREIHRLEQAVKNTNAVTIVAGYEKDEAVLGELT